MSAPEYFELLRRVTEGERLTRDEAAAAIRAVVAGEAGEAGTAALLAAWKTRGESPEEVAGVALALRERMVPVAAPPGAVDTCGTGGDGAGTFNVSTAAALVVAGAGAPVAKHGNRGVSSACGSADVFSALGVGYGFPPERAAAVLREAGIVFLFAPAHHPALAAVAPVRKALRLRTVFNVVGPLLNPAGVRRQVVGVARPELLDLVAGALAATGCEHGLVVHGRTSEGALDEIALAGETDVREVTPDGVRPFVLRASDLGLPEAPLSALAGGDAAENAATIRRILSGEERGPKRHVVVANAGAVLHVAGKADSISEGIALAVKSIDDGAAACALDRLVAEAGS